MKEFFVYILLDNRKKNIRPKRCIWDINSKFPALPAGRQITMTETYVWNFGNCGL